jgi:hypothetical protein
MAIGIPCIRALLLMACLFLFTPVVNAQSAIAKLAFPDTTNILPSLAASQCPPVGWSSAAVTAAPQCPGYVFPNVQLFAEELAVPLPSFPSVVQFVAFAPNSAPLLAIPNNSLSLVEFRLLGYRADATHGSLDKSMRVPSDSPPKFDLKFWSLWIPAGGLIVTAMEMDTRCWNIPGCVKGPGRTTVYPINLAFFAIAFYVSHSWRHSSDPWMWNYFPIFEMSAQSFFIGMHVFKVKIIQ